MPLYAVESTSRELWSGPHTAPGSMVLLGALPSAAGLPKGLCQIDGILYVITSTGQWRIDDPNSPEDAVHEGAYPSGLNSPRGGTAYMGQIYILDSREIWVADPGNPGGATEIADLPLSVGNGTGLATVGDVMYVVDATDDAVYSFPPASPGSATLAVNLPSGVTNPQSITGVGENLIVADVNETWLVDPTGGTAPSLIGAFTSGLSSIGLTYVAVVVVLGAVEFTLDTVDVDVGAFRIFVPPPRAEQTDIYRPLEAIAIDWFDTGLYDHPLSNVTADLVTYEVSFGLDADDDSRGLRYVPASGRLRLRSPAGRYDPGVTQELVEELRGQHLMRIYTNYRYEGIDHVHVDWEGLVGEPKVTGAEPTPHADFRLTGRQQARRKSAFGRSESLQLLRKVADAAATAVSPGGVPNEILIPDIAVAGVNEYGQIRAFLDKLAAYSGGWALEGHRGQLILMNADLAEQLPATVTLTDIDHEARPRGFSVVAPPGLVRDSATLTKLDTSRPRTATATPAATLPPGGVVLEFAQLEFEPPISADELVTNLRVFDVGNLLAPGSYTIQEFNKVPPFDTYFITITP